MRRSNWTIFRGALWVAVLVALSLPTKPLLADTTLNSGTTTVSTGTNFGTNLVVASTGTATMNVITGGSATNTFASIGELAGSSGTVNVSNGTWATSGTSEDDGYLNVGYGGTGTLNVTGGSVTSNWGVLGYGVGSVGTATVSGGTWANTETVAGTGRLRIGEYGTGTLTVSGGLVTSRICYMGNNLGSVATVNVSSGTWATNGDLNIGYGGTGTLNVSGGLVTNTYCYMGNGDPSTQGTATITGGTWANSGDLYVGYYDSPGTLTITGGIVTVGGILETGTGGTINIGTGGTTGVLRGGTGSVTNNGTLVFNRSDAVTYSGTISGAGAVTKQGAGRLTLARANSYSGITTISAGTIALSGTGRVGTGGLNLGTTGSPGVFDLSALTAGTYSLPSSASLTGMGALSGNGKSLAVLGSLAPGNSAGTITVGTGLSLDLSNSGTSVFEITNPAFTAGTYDLLNGDGSVVFGGILNLAFSGGSYAEGADVLQLFTNTGGRSGNFSAVNATGLAAGQSATFNPATGTITVVPEPSTYAIAAITTASLASLMRWRKQRTRESEA